MSSASYNNLFFCAKVSKSNKSWEYGGVKLLFYFGKILSSSNFFVRNCSIKHICGCIVTTFNTAPLLGRPDLWSWSSTTWDTGHQVPSYLLGEATPSWTLWQSDLMLLLCEMYLSLSPPHHRYPAQPSLNIQTAFNSQLSSPTPHPLHFIKPAPVRKRCSFVQVWLQSQLHNLLARVNSAEYCDNQHLVDFISLHFWCAI